VQAALQQEQQLAGAAEEQGEVSEQGEAGAPEPAAAGAPASGGRRIKRSAVAPSSSKKRQCTLDACWTAKPPEVEDGASRFS
jgi:hypothetical protein